MKRDNILATTRWTDKRQQQLLQECVDVTYFNRLSIKEQLSYQPAILQGQNNFDGDDVYRKRRPATQRRFYEPCEATPVRHWEKQDQLAVKVSDANCASITRSHLEMQPQALCKKTIHQVTPPQKLAPADYAPMLASSDELQETWHQYARSYGKLKVQIKPHYQLDKDYYDPNARIIRCRQLAQVLTDNIKEQGRGMFNITDYAPAIES